MNIVIHLNITDITIFWLCMMVFAYVVDVICLYFQSLRSLFIAMDLENFLQDGPSKYQIAKYFIWPFYIPGKIFYTIFFLTYEYKQYDIEEEEKLNNRIKEYEEKNKNKS